MLTLGTQRKKKGGAPSGKSPIWVPSMLMPSSARQGPPGGARVLCGVGDPRCGLFLNRHRTSGITVHFPPLCHHWPTRSPKPQASFMGALSGSCAPHRRENHDREGDQRIDLMGCRPALSRAACSRGRTKKTCGHRRHTLTRDPGKWAHSLLGSR